MPEADKTISPLLDKVKKRNACARMKKYRASAKGKAARAEYLSREYVKKANRDRTAKWLSSERGKKAQQLWQDRTFDRRSATHKAWYEKNRDRIAEKAAAPDRVAFLTVYRSEYHKSHPEVARKNHLIRKARKANAVIGDTAPIMAWEAAWRRKKQVRCYWCNGVFAGIDCHLDHVIALSKGGKHEIGNLCVSCSRCNLKKNAKTVDVWNQQIAEPVLL